MATVVNIYGKKKEVTEAISSYQKILDLKLDYVEQESRKLKELLKQKTR